MRAGERQWLVDAMASLGITQTRLAEEWGTDPSTVSRWVGQRGVTDDVLTFKRAITLARLLDIPLTALAERLGWADAGSLPLDRDAPVEADSHSEPAEGLQETRKVEVWSVTLNADATATVIIHANIPAEHAAPLVSAMAAAVKGTKPG